MDIKEKLSILADAAKYDASCSSSGSKRKRVEGGIGNAEGAGICHSYAPDGRCISLLKILLTNFCIYDCSYCINRVSSGVRRARFTPQEVANLTMDFYKRNYIEGLFLSSGVLSSADETMEELIEAARLLRVEYRFSGYIHLKAVAGASNEIVARAGLYADRVSANIEVPDANELKRLAPGKTHEKIESTMSQVKASADERRVPRDRSLVVRAPGQRLYLPAGQSTQLIVGASPSSDQTILQKSSYLYEKFKLRRVYYSAFSPIPDADPNLPLESPSLVREHRLYQADWLLRFYGFKVEELVTDASKNLSLHHDPKLSWALAHRGDFPIDVNRAPREQLLRVPGLGVRNVQRILSARRFRSLRLEDLARIRVPLSRTRYFVKTHDWNPSLRLIDSNALPAIFTGQEVKQLSLFDAPNQARTGEL